MPAPQVDFYLFHQPISLSAFIEPFAIASIPLFVFCDSEMAAATLDAQLWTERPASFIPHALQNTIPACIQIGWEPPTTALPFSRLFNYHPEVPAFYQQFSRIIEIIPLDDEKKQLARARYRYYQTHGCQLQIHPLGLNASQGIQ